VGFAWRRLREGRAHNGALRALVLALLLPLAVPVAAGAATVSVEPFPPPDIDPFGSCARYMTCPVDMVVVTGGSGEKNHLAITEAVVSPGQTRYLVRDKLAPVVAGAGCQRVDEPPPAVAVVCTAGAVGPQDLGDGDDWLASPGGWASGGDGDDVMTVSFGDADGGEGDDVLLVDTGEADGEAGDDVVIGGRGAGGSGHDRLMVGSGLGESGHDTLSCFPRESGCYLNGGAGDDVLTGDTGRDRLFGEGGRDLVRGGGRDDVLEGGVGDDRLIGGAGRDALGGGAGNDRLEARENRSAGEKPKEDRVDCGTGRRDQATVDRRDRVRRCERVTGRRGRAD
jgi:RTX calcium-binding nonapeptide repeat (4 copies)